MFTSEHHLEGRQPLLTEPGRERRRPQRRHRFCAGAVLVLVGTFGAYVGWCLYLLVLFVFVGTFWCFWWLLYLFGAFVVLMFFFFTHCILGNAQDHYFAKQEHYGNTMATLSFYAMLVMLTHHHHQFRRKLERFEVCSDAKRSWYGRSR